MPTTCKMDRPQIVPDHSIAGLGFRPAPRYGKAALRRVHTTPSMAFGAGLPCRKPWGTEVCAGVP